MNYSTDYQKIGSARFFNHKTTYENIVRINTKQTFNTTETFYDFWKRKLTNSRYNSIVIMSLQADHLL